MAVGRDQNVIGIIPAYAGSTWLGRQFTPTLEDHPRIRGEHYDFEIGCNGDVGSSPHTRGAPLEMMDPVQVWGIIPAYAGSTCWTL